MFSKFSEETQKVLTIAKKEMLSLKHPYVGSEHLFLAMLKENEKISEKFSSFGITYSSFREELIRLLGIGKEENQWFLYTPLFKRILENASLTAREMNSGEVQIYHLLLALIEEGDGVAIRILSELDVDIDDVYEEFSTKVVDKKSKQKRKLLIEEFGVDLTEKVSKGEIDPVIGRDKEVQRMIEILCRRGKNNPLLVGEAGVGKTAIVEELARKIVADEVPIHLKGKRIISVEIASLVAGTKYRGEFEERVHKILKEVESRNDVLVFIDEVHTLVGAGGAEGAIDASNILKPALARGKLRLIGATTLDEYKKTIEKDKAFDRRFQKIEILEPSEEETFHILKELKSIYSSFHEVEIADDLLKKIIQFTNQYMYNRKQPDKSIDILDEVCARVQLQKDRKHTKIYALKKELKSLQNQKKAYISKQDFQEALKLREQENALLSKLNTMEFRHKNVKTHIVTIDDIKQVLYDKTKIPIFDMDPKAVKEFVKMEQVLNQRVIGQKEAIHSLCDVTKRIKLGLRNDSRPASFLFVGPTGVGKTELVKEYVKFLNHNQDFIRLDMSEYRESHSISKIVGSPSGYVGYDDGKNILEEVRNHPYSILLLDEIEKAHPAVLNLFLQILDEGVIKDSTGRKIHFDHTIIIMTSNIGFGTSTVGFTEDPLSIHSKLKEYLSIEFLNRIDEVLIFQKLKEEDIRSIVQLKLKSVRERFAQNGVHLQIRKEVQEDIIKLSNYAEFGARKIDKTISQKIDSIVIDEILLGKKNVSIRELKV